MFGNWLGILSLAEWPHSNEQLGSLGGFNRSSIVVQVTEAVCLRLGFNITVQIPCYCIRWSLSLSHIFPQLKSEVTCKVCQYKSVRFDPFTFLSLPLPTESTVNLEVTSECKQNATPNHEVS